MPWTPPKDWQAGEIVTETDLDTYISGNDEALYERTIGAAADRVTVIDSAFNSTSSAYVSIPDLEITLTTTGGDVMVTFIGLVVCPGDRTARLAVTVDNGPEAVICFHVGNNGSNWNSVGASHIFTGVGAGTHTFRVRSSYYSLTTDRFFLFDAREIPGAAA